MPRTNRKNAKAPAATRLAECDVDDECPLLLPRLDETDDGETPLFGEDVLSELCFDIIADIDADDDDYDPDVKHLLSYPNNPKTKQKYVKAEENFKAFCNKRGINSYNKPKQVVNYLNDYIKKNSVGSIWSIYSALNNMFQQDYDVHLNKNTQLCHFMKAISKDYIPKKSEIITAANIKKLLTKKLSDNEPEELACKVYTDLVYFGLLRNSEAFKIQDTDITHNKQTKKLNVNFPYASKHCDKGFSFYIPKYMHKSFDRYKKQLANNGRFLRNWSNTSKSRVQNMGINRPSSKFCRMIEEKLGLKAKCLTSHFGRRSGAVALADAGISMPNLKRAGRWASTLAVEEYMEHSHASKKERLTLLDTKKKETASEKEANNIERSGATKMAKTDNNTVCSDDSNETRSNNDHDYSKTDQMQKTAPSTLSSAMLHDNKQQKKIKQAVTHKELPATFLSPPAVLMIALTFSKMLKSEFSKLASGHLNISNCTFNLGTMTTENRQVEVGNSPTHLPVPNVPTNARATNPYATRKEQKGTVFQPHVVTSTPTKIVTPIKSSVTVPTKATSKQYSLDEFYPKKKSGIESLGTGTKKMYVPEVHDIPSTERAIVPYAAARNPYASSRMTHTSQQKVSHCQNIASTRSYVPTHRWNTSPPTPATNSVRNLTDGIDFDAPFFPDSTGDTSKSDAFSYHNNFFP